MIRRLSHLWRDQAGMALVEFALVLPLAVALFFGTIETSRVVLSYMKLVNAAQSMADLIAQAGSQGVSSSNIADIVTAGQLVMTPMPGAGLTAAMTSVTFDPSTGKPAIGWQDARGQPFISNPTTLATGMGGPGDSVIIVQASYTYTSPFTMVLPLSFSFSQTAYARPRNVPVVSHS